MPLPEKALIVTLILILGIWVLVLANERFPKTMENITILIAALCAFAFLYGVVLTVMYGICGQGV